MSINKLSGQSQICNSSQMDEENQSIIEHLKNGSQADFFDNLEKKLNKLKTFVQELDTHKDDGITKQDLEHFQIDPEEFNQIDSNVIIKQTQRRIDKMKKSKKIKKNWSSSDMKVLIWIICKIAFKQQIKISQIQNRDDFWKLVSSLIPGTNPDSCLFKWLSLRRYKITLHGWKQSQEKLLVELQKKHNESKNKWKHISEQLYIENKDPEKIFRHPKQCRQHYASFLDPNIIKGPWTKQEDIQLLSYIILKQGEKKWCKLIKVLDGRTQNAIKNRYQLIYSKLKKKKENKNKNEYEIILEYLKENDPEFEIKKQRAQAVKIQEQEKSSAKNDTIKTIQSMKSMPQISITPQSQTNISQIQVKRLPIITINHGSSFRWTNTATQQDKKKGKVLGDPGNQTQKHQKN